MIHCKRLLDEVTFRLSITRQASNVLRRRIGSGFSPFQYIKLDEAMASRILADLLNPQGAHGQEELFLLSFHDRFCKSIAPPQFPVRVRCEAITRYIANSLRRMDILVEWQGGAIAVENKLWAADQAVQLGDYAEHLDRQCAGNFLLFYLTPDGREPDLATLGNTGQQLFPSRIVPISYAGDVIPWLCEVSRLAEAANVRDFIVAFAESLENKIS